MRLGRDIIAAALAALMLSGCASSADQTAECELQTTGLIPDQLASRACGGDAFAQYEIGLIYENGTDIPENLRKAAKWYKRAAARKSPTAPIYLAPVGNQRTGWVMPVQTGPVSPGDADAQYRLGLLYLKGRGVKQSRTKAKKWLKRAARQGHQEAGWLLERLKNKSTRTDN